MKEKNNKIVIITGASSGIGKDTAELFASRGNTVILAARRLDRLESISEELTDKGYRNSVFPVDLSDSSEVDNLVRVTLEKFGRIDVLVNNAGFGQQIELEKMKWEEIERMFQVNVLSLIALSRAVLPIMRSHNNGSIVNISSVGGLVPHPLNTIYCATKHAVVGFSRSLRLELKGSGIRVVTICPAGTKTEFFDVAGSNLPFPDFFSLFTVPASKVAEVIVRESEGNKSLVFPSLTAWFQAKQEKWIPFLSEFANIKYRDTVLNMRKRQINE